jgi:hypothetical protein
VRVLGSRHVDLAETRNLSVLGIYFHTSALLQIGQHLECMFILPAQFTASATPVLVGCRAKVLRLSKDKGVSQEITGAAVEIYSSDFSWQEAQVVGTQDTSA